MPREVQIQLESNRAMIGEIIRSGTILAMGATVFGAGIFVVFFG